MFGFFLLALSKLQNGRGFLYTVWPSVLSFKNRHIRKTKQQKNICIEEKAIILNPASEQSCFVFNKLT